MDISNINKLAMDNNAYRKVIHTSSHMQLVLMSLMPGEDVPLETHDTHDQFFHVVSGMCIIHANGAEYKLSSGMIMIVKAGTPHHVKNLSNKDKLKLYTIYSPPEHPDGLVQQLKQGQKAGSGKDFAHLYGKYKTKYLKLKQTAGSADTVWKVHVSLPWFNLIREGKKSVEGRPNRKDFAQMKVGDQIEFFNKELNENFMAEIINVSHHKTFEEMIKSNGIDNVLPGIRNLDEGVQVYMQYYTKEIEAEFGVVGIHVKLL